MSITTIQHRLQLSFEDYKSKIAIECNEDMLTYSCLASRVVKYTQLLQKFENSIKANPYILVYISSHLEDLIAHLAILQCGAVYIPLNRQTPIAYYSLKRMENIACMITDDFQIKESPDFPIIYTKKAEDSSCTSELNSRNGKLQYHNKHSHCIMTSGSTGVPKAVLLRQEAILNQIDEKIKLLKMDSDSRVCVSMSSSFIASIWQLLGTLFVGGTLILLDEKSWRNPYEIFSKADEAKATLLCTVPSVLRTFMLVNEGKRKLTLEKLISIVLTGELLHSGIVKSFYKEYNIQLINAYGQTETSDDTFHYVIPNNFDCSLHPIVPIGYPINNINYSIINNEDSDIDGDGKGELCIAGICLATGYLWDKAQTERAFKSQANSSFTSFLTGDIVSQSSDGMLICHGRRDNQLKINGYRIDPEALELCCMSIKGISDAIAFKEESLAGAHLVLQYVSVKNSGANEADIKAYLSKKLPEYMLPNIIEEVDSIAYNSNGKKKRDISMLKSERYSHTTTENTNNSVLDAVKKAVQNTIGVDLNENDNFVKDLNSLEYVSLLVELEDIFGIEFDTDKLYANAFSSSHEFVVYIAELIENKEYTS